MMGPTLKSKNVVLMSPMVYPGMDMSHHLRWLNDPAVMKYSEQRHTRHTRHTQYHYLQHYADSPDYIWDIRTEGAVIGSITACCDPYNRVANVGILIGDTDYRGRGYAGEAYELVCDFLFEQQNYRKIEAGTMGANAPMIKVLEKLNFIREAVVQDHFILNGKPQDLYLYGKFREAKIVPFQKDSAAANGV